MKRFILAMVLGVFSIGANAAPLRWTLNDVIFDDGATATGSFDTELIGSAAPIVSNVQITVSNFIEVGDYGSLDDTDPYQYVAVDGWAYATLKSFTRPG